VVEVTRRRLAFALGAVAMTYLLVGCIGPVPMGGGDAVHNYDYDLGGATAPLASYTPQHRDMPVEFVFAGPGATFDRVNAILNKAGATSSGGVMSMPIKDTATWQKDSSKGRKVKLEKGCGVGFFAKSSYLHMRYYANPSVGYSSNKRFGHYVVGTAHYDHHEGCDDEWSGASDAAEVAWNKLLRCIGHLVVTPYKVWMDNAEAGYKVVNGRRDLKHPMQSDGWATKVYIPAGLVPERVC
jgi:hypothetical protein